jgi:hypothetical protein
VKEDHVVETFPYTLKTGLAALISLSGSSIVKIYENTRVSNKTEVVRVSR